MSSAAKILIGTFTKLDFRDKENSGRKKFFGIFISYLFANSVLSLNNFLSFKKESYVILAFSTGVFLLVFIVLNDFGGLFFSKRFSDVIDSLPVPDSDIVLSKFISAFLYLLTYTVIIAIPQVIFFGLYETGTAEIISFFFANISCLFFITGVILFLYTVSYKIFSKKSNIILYFLQFIFFFYVIAASSLASKLAIEKADLLSIGIVKYLPQFYFSLSVNNPVILLPLFILTIFIFLLYFLYLKKNYRKISSVIFSLTETQRGKRKSIFSKYNEFIGKSAIKNNEERASYLLTVNQFRNSKTLKLKFVPFAFLPVIVNLIALFTDTYIFHSIFKSTDNILILTPSVSFTFIMCVRLLISATKVEDGDSPDIKWIFESVPLLSVKRIQNANIKFVYANFAFPLIVVLFIMMSLKFQILHLLLNMIFLLSATFLLNTIFLISDKIYPYSLESTKYSSASKLGEIFFIMLIGAVIFIAQIFIFENVIFVIVSVILLLLISFLLKKKSFTLRH